MEKVREKGSSKTVTRVTAGDVLERLVRRALYEPGFRMPVTVRPGRKEEVALVPGHVWGQHFEEWAAGGDCPPVDGPRPARVMVVGKLPGEDEALHLRNFVGPTGEVLTRYVDALKIRGARKWYVTNLVKFRPPDGSNDLKAPWVATGKHLLAHELRLVRPDFVLCLGSDASKALLGPKATVAYMDGRVEELTYDYGYDDEEGARTKTALVMTVLHPAQVARDQSMGRTLERGLARFKHLLEGRRPDDVETDVDHRVVSTLDGLRRLLAEVDADPDASPVVACDAEWHGQHPVNAGSYLRLFQFSWKPKSAAAVTLTGAGGVPAFLDADGSDARAEGIALLSRWFEGRRVVGHFFNADLEWLVHAGLDLRRQFQVPRFDAGDGTPAWARTRSEGGADTGLMAHAVEESANYGLEALATRYLVGVPRYDIPMAEWCKSQKEKFGVLEGYGEAPDDLILPYACLHGESLVQLADGSWEKIRSLVARRYSGCVKALVDGRVVDARVTGWHRNDVGQREWLRLRTLGSQEGRWGLLGPILTPDHKVVTQRGKVRVDDLAPGEDRIATEEREFTPDQLSVFLGSLLGDGGYLRRNRHGVGFGFSQRAAAGAYADWKAEVFASHGPERQPRDNGYHRYHLPFSRYLFALSLRFPAHPRAVHQHRKAVITPDLLANLGDLGLAVWYQDDGTLVTSRRDSHVSSRIYCLLPPEDERLVVDWLSRRFGVGVRYNRKGRFLQITGEAFPAFHAAIRPYVHPWLAYKVPDPPETPPRVDTEGPVYYEPIVEVVPWAYEGPRRGNGVRYCLTVPDAGNFLTKSGFVSNCYDADVTLRLFHELDPLLDCDYEGNCCREAFWESMMAAPAVLEIHQTGITVDKARVDDLTVAFVEARDERERRIREWAAWPGFNIRSVFHVREFLFGEDLAGKFDAATGRPVRQRPPDAVSLLVDPVLDTSKPPKPWPDLVAQGLADRHTPGTSKAVLPQLIRLNPGCKDQLEWLRDHRILDQVLKSVLRPPSSDADGAWLRDEDTGLVYDAGLAKCVCDDGRVRTHIYQTKETGRWSSARPPLQNISKTRDRDYKRMLGDRYKHKLRSILRAAPGHALVEADYKGAELFGTAVMAGDAAMIDHAQRSNLPDEGYDERGNECPGGKFPHPDYYDIHSNIAVLAFKLDCPPTKNGLKEAGFEHLRTLAKRRIFGLLYGQSDESSVQTAREEGVFLEVEEARAVTRAIFATYPGLEPFFESCRERATVDRWLCHCFGRFRRFPYSADRKLQGEFERQAMNFPIQGMIASAVNRAVSNLYFYREDVGAPDLYRIVLQIHDAVLLEVPLEHVDFVVGQVVPYCMRDQVPIYPTDLAGVPTGLGPYFLGYEVEVAEHWGEKLPRERWRADAAA